MKNKNRQTTTYNKYPLYMCYIEATSVQVKIKENVNGTNIMGFSVLL